MAGTLFEDIFDVKDINPEGKKFERGKYRVGVGLKLICVSVLYSVVRQLRSLLGFVCLVRQLIAFIVNQRASRCR